MSASYKIISQNKHWICVYKKALTLSVPSRFGAKETRPCVGIELQNEIQQPLFPTHRLDFEVSGLLIFAKNTTAHRELNRYFEQRQIRKIYLARTLSQAQAPHPLLYKGLPAPFQIQQIEDSQLPVDFHWSCRIAEGKRRSFVAPHGRESQTLAQAIESGVDDQERQTLLWKLEPQTGRQHQLRLHLSLAGYPIMGDERYGGAPWSHEGVALSATELDFTRCQKSEELGLPERFSAAAFDVAI
jgi:tRNA pseudouridine32 synthase / 23S rRNA pseudouridine746 synthase